MSTSGVIGVEELRKVDEKVAGWVANLHATIEAQSPEDRTEPAKGLRGLLVGQLNGVLGGDDDKRHVFLETVLRRVGGSSNGMSLAEFKTRLKEKNVGMKLDRKLLMCFGI